MSWFHKSRTAPPPVTYEQTFQVALTAQKQGQVEASRELFKRVASGVPEDPTPCHFLGLSYFGKDYAESVNWFAECLSRSRDNPQMKMSSLAFLAQCFKELGDRKQAMICLRSLHTESPEFAEELAETLGLLDG